MSEKESGNETTQPGEQKTLQERLLNSLTKEQKIALANEPLIKGIGLDLFDEDGFILETYVDDLVAGVLKHLGLGVARQDKPKEDEIWRGSKPCKHGTQPPQRCTRGCASTLRCCPHGLHPPTSCKACYPTSQAHEDDKA